VDHIGRDIVEYGRTVILGILSASYRDATHRAYLGSLKAMRVEAAGTFSSCGNNAGSRIAA